MKFLHSSIAMTLVMQQVLLVSTCTVCSMSLRYGGCTNKPATAPPDLCVPLFTPVSPQYSSKNGLHLVHFSAPRDLPFLAPLIQQPLEQDDDPGTTSHLVPAAESLRFHQCLPNVESHQVVTKVRHGHKRPEIQNKINEYKSRK